MRTHLLSEQNIFGYYVTIMGAQSRRGYNPFNDRTRTRKTSAKKQNTSKTKCGIKILSRHFRFCFDACMCIVYCINVKKGRRARKWWVATVQLYFSFFQAFFFSLSLSNGKGANVEKQKTHTHIFARLFPSSTDSFLPSLGTWNPSPSGKNKDGNTIPPL